MLGLSARAGAVLAALLLAACAATAPTSPVRGPGGVLPALGLRLAPAALGRELALDQWLQFTVDGQVQVVQARLEADAGATRLLMHQHGRPLLRLAWDGDRLEGVRAEEAPVALDPQRILDDVQLVYWPADAVRAALPRGWTLADTPRQRSLRQGREPVVQVDYHPDGSVRLEHRRLGYVLDIRVREAPP